MADRGVQLLARGELFPAFGSLQEALDYLTTAAVNINASKHMSYAFFCLLVYDHRTLSFSAMMDFDQLPLYQCSLYQRRSRLYG
jgi:hypothetical protein